MVYRICAAWAISIIGLLVSSAIAAHSSFQKGNSTTLPGTIFSDAETSGSEENKEETEEEAED